jgi:hypothetical protein
MSLMKETGEPSIATRLLRLSAALHGLVTGLLLGLLIFLATNWLVLKGGAVVGPHLALLAQFFPGYRVTFVGSLIGLGYGFVVGFAIGFAIAWLYNRLLVLRAPGPAPRR